MGRAKARPTSGRVIDLLAEGMTVEKPRAGSSSRGGLPTVAWPKPA